MTAVRPQGRSPPPSAERGRSPPSYCQLASTPTLLTTARFRRPPPPRDTGKSNCIVAMVAKKIIEMRLKFVFIHKNRNKILTGQEIMLPKNLG